MQKAIVIGGSHYNVIGVIRSLGEAGYHVVLFIEPCDLSRYLWRFSKYVKEVETLHSMDEITSLLINKYQDQTTRIPVVCASDGSVCKVDENYTLLAGHFHIFNIRRKDGLVNHYMDKRRMQEMAHKCGLNIIPTWYVNSKSDITDDISYPCFVKGNNSVNVSKDAICICNNKSELEKAVQEGLGYLVQEYIRTDCEVNINGLSLNNGDLVLIPGAIVKERQSLRRMGEYMRLDGPALHTGINFELVKNFVREIGYEGTFSVDFLKKDDKYYFLEINLRNDALSYIFTKSGVNLPALWAKSACSDINEEEIRKLKCKTPFHMMWWLADIQNVFEGKISLLHWVKDFIVCDGDMMLSWCDPGPFLYLVWRGIRRLFLKPFHVLGFKKD